MLSAESQRSQPLFDDPRARSLILGAMLGALCTRLASILLPIEMYGFMLHLSLPAMVILCVFMIDLLTGQHRTSDTSILMWMGTAIGVILDETLWLIVRNPPLVPSGVEQVGYWSTASLLFSIGGLLLFSIGVAIGSRTSKGEQILPRIETPHLAIASVVLIGGLIFFHVSQAMIRHDVPNEDRSLVILGYEIHHIVEGQILLMIALVLLVFAGEQEWPWRFAFLFTTIGALFVADEILYYQLIDVSDDAYFGAMTITSGAMMCTMLLVQMGLGSRHVGELEEE